MSAVVATSAVVAMVVAPGTTVVSEPTVTPETAVGARTDCP
ncbi:hypothetical protein [Streptomyces sp. G45]